MGTVQQAFNDHSNTLRHRNNESLLVGNQKCEVHTVVWKLILGTLIYFTKKVGPALIYLAQNLGLVNIILLLKQIIY